MVVVVGLVTAAVSSNCPDYCCTTYIHLNASSIPSGTSECFRLCNITINELSATQIETRFEWYYHRVTSCSNRLFLFQSGIHHVKDSQSTLSFHGIDSVIIRGEPNATIRCWDTTLHLFVFYSIPNVTIRDMHIWNCSCNYHFRGYMYNGTDFLKVYHLVIELLNSTFTNSRLYYQNPEHKSHSMDTKIKIKDTIIQNT